MSLIANLAQNQEDINQARHLLHNHYIKELDWQIDSNNPSNIKIIRQGNLYQLTDDYDDLSNWFTTYNDQGLIACARLCGDDDKGLLEVERYDEAQKKLDSILKSKYELNLIELNREAFLTTHPSNKTACLLLLQLIFEYCLWNNLTLLTTTNIVNWVCLYEKIRFPKLKGYEFKYLPSDKKTVGVYLAEHKGLLNMLDQINLLTKRETEQRKLHAYS